MPKSLKKSLKRPSKTPAAAIRERVLDAALDVASRTPWEVVSLYEIAEVAGIGHAELAGMFPTREAIFLAVVARCDAAVIAAYAVTEDGSLRDKLFDIFMEKFDYLNTHRAGYISMVRAFGWDKPSTCAHITLMQESCTRLARHIGMDVQGIIGRGQVVVLALALVPVWWAWMHDESPDLAATMASLDKALSHCEKLAEYFTRRAY